MLTLKSHILRQRSALPRRAPDRLLEAKPTAPTVAPVRSALSSLEIVEGMREMIEFKAAKHTEMIQGFHGSFKIIIIHYFLGDFLINFINFYRISV